MTESVKCEVCGKQTSPFYRYLMIDERKLCTDCLQREVIRDMGIIRSGEESQIVREAQQLAKRKGWSQQLRSLDFTLAIMYAQAKQARNEAKAELCNRLMQRITMQKKEDPIFKV